MDRRKSLKLIATGALASGVVAAGCSTEEKKLPADPNFTIDRYPDELKNEKELLAQEPFFSDHEMATITVLTDIIIPRDDVSGSASDAKVPEFIEFIVKDMPQHQIPMHGGLKWLDVQCLKKYDKVFTDCDEPQRLAMVDMIAYPEKAKNNKDLSPGVAFFSLIRNLAATGFYTSEIGVKDLGYEGNVVTKWNGVPEEVLKQYNLSYSEKELKECVSFDKKV